MCGLFVFYTSKCLVLKTKAFEQALCNTLPRMQVGSAPFQPVPVKHVRSVFPCNSYPALQVYVAFPSTGVVPVVTLVGVNMPLVGALRAGHSTAEHCT